MQKIALIVAILVVSGNTVSIAAEFERNPDRFPSVGLSLGIASETGDQGATCSICTPSSVSQDLETDVYDLTFDTRIPVSQSLTLFGIFAFASTLTESDETSFLAGVKTDTSGFAPLLS